jgi:very-short-patch-repair endonuclease
MPHAVVSQRQRGRAKQLRKAMTPAETLLWRYLKASRIDGLGFRRQTPIRNYIVDFVCLAVKLTVELDGESHDFEERQNADQNRDAFFVSEGFQVLRFTNKQVMSNLEGVASDATIRKIGEFSNYMIATSYENSDKRDPVLHKRQLAEVLLAMRDDCFEKTRLSIEEASQLLPMQ